MSDNNQQNDFVESKSEPLQNEEQLDSNHRPSVTDLPKTDVVLSDIKTDIKNKEIVIDVNGPIKVIASGDVKDAVNVDYLIYGHYGQQIRPPKSTWVYFQGSTMPADSTPLDYDPESRNGFIRLTLTILLFMLLCTAGFVIPVIMVDDLKYMFRRYALFIIIPATVVMIGLTYAMACSSCTRIFPCNIIMLVLSVICMSLICAVVTSRYRTEIVFYALIATCIVVFVCVLLAFSRFDFTAWMLYIVMIGAAFSAVCLIFFIVRLVTGTRMKMVHLGILLVGTLLNVVVLAMELQMVIGGRTVELGEDEYALGAFMLYTSIIDIFLKLVNIIGIADSL